MTENQAILLSEGMSIAGFLNTWNATELFKFKPSMYGQFMSNIDISVTPISGWVRFSVSVNEIPSLKKSNWKSFDKHLIIKTSDKNFSNDGTYYVLVYQDDLTTQNSSSYQIKWSTANTHNLLKTGVPLNGRTVLNEIDYYKYIINSEDLNKDILI